MKLMKKLTVTGLMVMAISTTGVTAFAASQYSTPAEMLAGLTGRTIESVLDERAESNKTYGTIAREAGLLEEFKSEVLEMKKDILSEQVAAGTITQEKADAIITALEDNQANCDGEGNEKICKSLGAQFGEKGKGKGLGLGNGTGTRNGQGGRGMGLRDGSCVR